MAAARQVTRSWSCLVSRFLLLGGRDVKWRERMVEEGRVVRRHRRHSSTTTT